MHRDIEKGARQTIQAIVGFDVGAAPPRQASPATPPREGNCCPLPKVLAIVGPTASGKTGAAVSLCNAIDGEVVSIDSMQIYQGMKIGTARIKPDEAQGVPHHMIAVAAPDVPYSVAEYANAAITIINDILHRGKVPVLAGGTGLYLEGIRRERSYSHVPGDHLFRAPLENLSDEQLYEKLLSLDSIAASRIHPANRRRVIRAIEIITMTGKPPLTDTVEPRFDILTLGIKIPKETLDERISKRVHAMLAEGLVDEVRFLLRHGVNPAAQSMQAIGYKEICKYLAGECSYEEAVERTIIGTRQYAKRQMTWFKRTERIRWFEPLQFPCIESFHKEVINMAQRFLRNEYI